MMINTLIPIFGNKFPTFTPITKNIQTQLILHTLFILSLCYSYQTFSQSLNQSIIFALNKIGQAINQSMYLSIFLFINQTIH